MLASCPAEYAIEIVYEVVEPSPIKESLVIAVVPSMLTTRQLP